MPRLKSETLGAGDMSWLDSDHGITNAKTDLLNVSAFTAGTHYPNGFIPSGTPVAKASGLLVPYTSAEGTTTGAGVFYGHVLTDQAVVGAANFAVPVFKHGRVKAARVPTGTDAFTVPVAAAKRVNVFIDYV